MLGAQIGKRVVKIGKLKRHGKNAEYLEELKKFKKELEQMKRDIEQGIAIVDAKINSF